MTTETILPKLIGTLAALPEHTQRTIQAYGAACYRTALQSPEIQSLRKNSIGWKPIETAPQQGRRMILLLTPSRFPQVAWSDTWWLGGFSVENKPTHWMPLPELPDSAAMEQQHD